MLPSKNRIGLLLILFTLACSVAEKEFIQPKPVALEASEIEAISFRANWQVLLTAQSYLVDVAKDANFNEILPNYRSLEVTENSLLVQDLEVGHTYYYRVRAKINNVVSNFSNTIKVTTNENSVGAVLALFPTQITLESFIANWRGVAVARSYTIEVATDAEFTNILPNYNQVEVQNTQLLINNLQPNTTYFYRVRAKRGGFSTIPSNVISVKTNTLEKPNILIANQVGLNTFQANWNKVIEANEYILDVAQDVNFQQILPDYQGVVLRDTSRIVRNLQPKTNYFYRVRAKRGNFLSEFSNSMSVQTNGLEIPTALPASLVELSSFRANWQAIADIDNYVLTISLDADFRTPLPQYNRILVKDNFLVITGLRPNTTYFYRIATTKLGFTSEFSNIIGVTTKALESPITIAASDIDFTSFVARWQAVEGAESYFLDVAEDFDFNRILPEYNGVEVRGLFRTVRNLEIGKTYYYRVRARKDNFTSGNSNVSSVGTRSLDGVTALPATDVEFTKFKANWTALQGADSYIVEVSEIGDFSTLLGGYNGLRLVNTSIEVSGLSAGKTYYYRVRGVRGSFITPYSNVIAVTTRNFDAPIALSAANINFTSFNARWEAVRGATSYLLEVSTDINFKELVGDYKPKELLGTNETITGLSSQKSYYYRVRAKGAGAISAYSNIINVVTLSLNPPVALEATNITLSSFRANWQIVNGASSYILEVATDVGFINKIAGYQSKEVLGTFDIVTGLLPQTTYYYRVRARIGGAAVSAYSNIIAVVSAALNPPVATAATSVTLTSFVANWNASPNATSYLITIALNPTFTNILAGYNDLEINVTSLNIGSLVPNTTYFYRLKAKNGASVSGVSNVIDVTTTPLDAPVALAASSIGILGFQANWQSVTNASSYILDVATDMAFTDFVTGYNGKEIISLSEVVTNLVPNTTYYYRVRAKGLGSTSTNSNVVTLTLLPLPAPVATAPTINSAEQIIARWNVVAEANSYLLDIATDNMFTTILPSFNNFEVLGTSQVADLVDIRKNHFYRVRAKRGTAISVNSNIITANNGVNNGANICKITAYPLLSSMGVVIGSINFTYPSAASTLPNRIANTFLDIRFDITYSGTQITQAQLRQNSGAFPLYQTWFFTYDGAGNVASIRIEDNTATFVELWTFTYNAQDRITSWRRYSDVAGTVLIEERGYEYDAGAINPKGSVNLTTMIDEFDWVYDTRINPFRLLSKDLAVMINYTTNTAPTPATPNPNYARILPFLPTNNILTETFNPTATSQSFIYTYSTKGVANRRRLSTGGANPMYTFTGCSL